jgi:transglycosylase-like protein with SLT domain
MPGHRAITLSIMAVAWTVAAALHPAAAEPAGDARPGDARLAAICRLVDQAAAANRLPPGFLARILWQESRFHSDARSPAGAVGIAQFLLATAAERGLADPREPAPAIAAAARMLAELASRFGNMGLAAAAYDAGAGRTEKWLRAQASLPSETREYVLRVTGRPPEHWTGDAVAALGSPELAGGDCLAAIGRIMPAAPQPRPLPAWQARLDDSLARSLSLLAAADGDRSSRGARALCDRIRSLGASCNVYTR